MNKNLLWLIVIIIVIGGGYFLFFREQPASEEVVRVGAIFSYQPFSKSSKTPNL